MEKTLVYIASGPYKPIYNSLEYDRIFLIDTYFKHRTRLHQARQSSKVILWGLDALDSVERFKKEGIQIDCLITLCESRGEGGQTYAMCSDVFMGYIMPLLAKDFLWICNDTAYYQFSKYCPGKAPYIKNPNDKMRRLYGRNYVSLDLPYTMLELSNDNPDYLSPSLFSDFLNIYNRGHVFRMSYSPTIEIFRLSEDVTIRLIRDSIWNHYEELDHLFISFKLEYNPMKNYFENFDKVSYYEQMDFGRKLRWAESNELKHIGFTPHYWYLYDRNYQKQLESFIRELGRPMIIDLYFMSSWFDTRHIKKAIKTIQQERSSNI